MFEGLIEACAQEKAEANAKVNGLLRVREAEIREAVKDLSPEQVIQNFATLNIEISKGLLAISEAKKQVQDIAVKAIDGASGAKKALSHINQIALEQAKGRPQLG